MRCATPDGRPSAQYGQPRRRHAALARVAASTTQPGAAAAAPPCRRAVLLGGAALAAGGLAAPPPSLAAAPPPGGPQVPQGEAGLLVPPPQPAAGAARLEAALESRVTRLQLPNGLRILVIRRPDAPVVSINTYVTAGAWVEEDGQTGVAHLLEHLAFKGTPRLGSRDWRQEAALLRAVDEAFYDLSDARRGARAAAVGRLQEQFDSLQAAAQELVVPNAFAQALTTAGAVGLNAATSHDCTRYYCSLPANQLELWFALEAERFQAPVFRELYREKQVVAEERASRVDNSPLGSLFADWALRSLGNPYRRPVLGFSDDLDALGRREVAGFFAKYYHPANVTIAIAGAAEPTQVLALAERYFGAWAPPDPASAVTLGPASPDELDAEPSARPAGGGGAGGGGGGGSLDYVTSSRAGPLALLGYYRPPLLAPSAAGPALEAAVDVLAGGRAARLAVLAREGALLGADAGADYPGDAHAGLVLLSARPRPGDSPQRAAALLQAEADRLCTEGPTPAELARVQKAARAQLLGTLTSNSGLAASLVAYEAVTGSWRGALEELSAIEALTPGDVRDAAAATLRPDNCITALVSAARGV